jgi:SAM-dependent methyltransferase
MTAPQAAAAFWSEGVGDIADEIERLRPDYPEPMITDVLAYAGPAGRGALEIGAGTGKATVAFAARGVRLTALEPDEQMAGILARHLDGRPNATVHLGPFEDFAPPAPYDLVYSAGSWHWLDPAVRCARAAALLPAGGTLALFWNSHWPSDPAVRAALLALHQARAPHILPDARPLADGRDTSWPRSELLTRPEFADLTERSYERRRVLSRADYLAYLATISRYRRLDAGPRAELLALIAAEVGPEVTLTVETSLFLVRRAADGPA